MQEVFTNIGYGRVDLLYFGFCFFPIIANPTEFWQEDPVVFLFELNLCGIWITKTSAAAFPFKAGKVGTLGEEVFVGSFQIF